MKTKISIADLASLSLNKFQLSNSFRNKHIPQPFKIGGWKTGIYELEDNWMILGKCVSGIDEHLMIGREGQICLMFFHSKEGECWTHFPAYDEDDYSNTFLVGAYLFDEYERGKHETKNSTGM